MPERIIYTHYENYLTTGFVGSHRQKKLSNGYHHTIRRRRSRVSTCIMGGKVHHFHFSQKACIHPKMMNFCGKWSHTSLQPKIIHLP